eukprot:Pgem_evm1s3050
MRFVQSLSGLFAIAFTQIASGLSLSTENEHFTLTKAKVTENQLNHLNYILELQAIREQGGNVDEYITRRRRFINIDEDDNDNDQHRHHDHHHHSHSHDGDDGSTCGYQAAREQQFEGTTYQYYPNDTRGTDFDFENRRRAVYENNELYQNIRIKPYWAHLEQTTHPEQALEVKQYVSSAIRFLQKLLKVKPVSQPLYIEELCTEGYRNSRGHLNCINKQGAIYGVCGNVPIPEEHKLGLRYDNGEILQTGKIPQGFRDADMVVYVSSEETGCNENTIAFATSCSRDQFGRPLQTTINVCPRNFFNIQSYTIRNDVLLHELLHAVGFSGDDMEHFSHPVTGQKLNIDLIRPMVNGIPHIRTQGVMNIMNNYYNCYDFPYGMPFEHLGGPGTAGAHFDQSFLNSELMTGVMNNQMHYLSGFTLAFLEDSGWYQVDYKYAGNFQYGRNVGCNLEATCGRETYAGHAFNAASLPVLAPSAVSTGGVCSYDHRFINGGFSSSKCKNILLENSGDFDPSVCGPNTRCLNTFERNANVHLEFLGLPAARIQSASCAPMQCIDNNQAVVIDYQGQSFTCILGQRDIAISTRSITPGAIQYLRCPDVQQICGTGNLGSDLSCKYGSWNTLTQMCICQNGYKGRTCELSDHNDPIISQVQLSVSPSIPGRVCVSHANNPSINGQYHNMGRVFGQSPIYSNTNQKDISLEFDFKEHLWVFFSIKQFVSPQNPSVVVKIQKTAIAMCDVGTYEPN